MPESVSQNSDTPIHDNDTPTNIEENHERSMINLFTLNISCVEIMTHQYLY